MSEVLVDASAALKWFVEDREDEVDAARRLLAAHRDGVLTASILDLTAYEIGNVLLRALRQPAEAATLTVTGLRRLCASIVPTPTEHQLAAVLAAEHRLSYYDASYAAVARSRGMTLVTADRELLAIGGVSCTAVVMQLGLAGETT